VGGHKPPTYLFYKGKKMTTFDKDGKYIPPKKEEPKKEEPKKKEEK